jgi:hypothetical protein
MAVRDGQPSPHRTRLVVSRITCPPISPPPHANSFVLGPAVINTHMRATTSHSTCPPLSSPPPHAHSFVLGTVVINNNNSPALKNNRHTHALDGLLIPDCLLVRLCTSHPGVLGSIPKRQEPEKTGASCVEVPGSSRVPSPPRTAL